ncbi:MAG: hypothetical protein IJT32_02425 [Lachnospiraceae bacterium]|nr:hypothetical protein [Lachnospiraceae bacterium]
MNLHQEISLDTIKNLFRRKKKKSEHLKTTINFVRLSEEKGTNWFLAIPGIIAIVIGAVLFSKLAVIDRYGRLSRAQGEVAALEDQIAAGMEELNGSGELTEQFYHYTWTGMTEEELSRESRVRITGLIGYIDERGLAVNACSLSGNILTLNVTGASLEQISKVMVDVRGQEIVDTASVSMAQTKEAAEDAVYGVDAQLIINIKPVAVNDGGDSTEGDMQ